MRVISPRPPACVAPRAASRDARLESHSPGTKHAANAIHGDETAAKITLTWAFMPVGTKPSINSSPSRVGLSTPAPEPAGSIYIIDGSSAPIPDPALARERGGSTLRSSMTAGGH